jgi:hypothetical protein
MARLFISYGRRDGRTLADRLHQDLQQHGHEAWLDRPEIRPGEGWALEIEQGIDRSDGLLALLTHRSYESEICRGEHGRALRKGKFVIPLLVQADADRPVYLEGDQYVDFTAAERYPDSLQALLTAIEQRRGATWNGLSDRDRQRLEADSASSLTEPLSSWDALRERAAQHTTRLLAELHGTARQPGPVVDEISVDRPAAEAGLRRVVEEDCVTAAIIGDAGVGKTTLLGRWAQRVAAEGHAVFLYAGGSLHSPDVGQQVCRDLLVDEGDALPRTLSRIEELAAQAGRTVVVIVDGINDFSGTEGAGAESLVRAIGALTARLPGRWIRLVLSCSTPTWSRLDRADVLRHLHWGRLLAPGEDERLVTLGLFTPPELEQAYARYTEYFGLRTAFADLSPAARERLREPLLLRLLAESYRNRDERITTEALDAGVLKGYLEEKVRRPKDRYFVEQIVAEMFERQRANLRVQDLARHEQLGPEVRNDEADGPFQRLLEQGVLTLTPGDLFVGDTIGFSSPVVAGYALAQHLTGRAGPVARTVDELLQRVDVFPLAWDTAQSLLLVSQDVATFVELAESTDAERRGLVAESLRRLHAVSPDAARGMLQRLLDGESGEARRTALKAAYGIGPATRDLFMRAAMRGSPDLRRAAKDTLYLIWRQAAPPARRALADVSYLLWRHDPDFTYGFLRDLVGRLRLRDLASIRNTLEFILDLSVTIYINHCDRPEVIRQTDDLYRALAVDQLHLDRVNLGETIEKLLLRALATAFSGPILDWMLFSDRETPERLFTLPEADRARLGRLALALDPASDLEAVEDDLKLCLQHPVAFLNGAAGLVLAVHSCVDAGAVEPLHRRLFEALDSHGRLWQLLSFSVLLPDTPKEWIGLLEDCTRRLLEETPEALDDPTAADLFGVPLGLAYAKAEGSMPLYDEWLRDGLDRADPGRVRRVLAGLGPVGFYYPQAVFDTLGPVLLDLARPPHDEALLAALAIVRTLHFDAVDAFLIRSGVEEPFRRRVSATAEVALVHRYITVLGFYNNAVHFSIHYPRMRRAFSAGALDLVAQTTSPADFIARYAAVAIKMFRDANFNLVDWTRPEP